MNKIRVRKIIPSGRNIGTIFVMFEDETYEVKYIDTFFEYDSNGNLIQYAYENKFFKRN